ncbi:Uncharacterised protein [Pseudomonas fluorescens]|uniref:HNH domain-containing protein n=1 Tax=Pseudomonas fluorescens TaxID=294 RepID=A0A379IBX0_PSEFL|nr:hypothetical protein [Pseudomonas fluorescens]AIG00709.1 hypothetical protein HZ99_00345 [Pseudomonas fluorescens]SUD30375.1 Uncharacterised protein [Pseudomonas fluorescens]
MIINVSDMWYKARTRHRTFVASKIDDMLIALRQFKGPCQAGVMVQYRLADFMAQYKNQICRELAGSLRAIAEDFRKRFKSKSERKAVRQLLENYLNYKSFSAKPSVFPPVNWCAYALCSTVDYVICPYCHMASIDVREGDESISGYRGSLDHYYPKAAIPFLSLTLGNLVLACEQCNGSSMKGSKRFDKIAHLHPFLDQESIGFSLVFRGKKLSVQHWALDLDSTMYKIRLSLPTDNQERKKAIHSIRTFQLGARYQLFVEKALSVQRISRVETRPLAVNSQLTNFKVTRNDYIGVDPLNYKNTLAGKFMVDIAKQFDFI